MHRTKWRTITSKVKNMRYLITGGTGSIGQQLVKTLLPNKNIQEIRIFSRDEEKQYTMQQQYPNLTYIIGNIKNLNDITTATKNITHLIHTAALKIIPTCENQPSQAIQTNIQGTINVKKAVITNNIQKATYINTDKAVYPINTYGATKLLAEKIWITGPTKPCFTTVRYGNVLNSRGSVIPYFKKLIHEQKPLTLTHPEMTRFFITKQQAAKLIIQVNQLGQPNHIYIPKLKSCKILDLAKTMTNIYNYPITITGIRPGEKIHETLITQEEWNRTHLSKEIYIIHPYNDQHPYSQIKNQNPYTSQNSIKYTTQELKQILREQT